MVACARVYGAAMYISVYDALFIRVLYGVGFLVFVYARERMVCQRAEKKCVCLACRDTVCGEVS